MSFAERVLSLLSEKNIPQSKMLSDLGLGKNQLAYWKKNQNIPNAIVVEKISSYLDVSVDYLLGKTDVKKDTPASKVSDKDIMFALWGDASGMGKEDLDDVKRYADFVRERKKKK